MTPRPSLRDLRSWRDAFRTPLARALVAWGIGSGALIGGTALYLNRLKASEEQATFLRADASVEVAQQALLRAVETAGALHGFVQLRQTLSDSGNTSGAAAIEAEIGRLVTGRLGIVQVSIADEHGRLRWGTAPGAAGLYVGDREHVMRHIEGLQQGLFLSAPVIGRTTGRWSIQLSRRLLHDDGSFAGVSIVSIDPIMLSQSLGEVGPAPGRLVVIRRLDDGALVARSRGAEQHLARPPQRDHPAVVAARAAPAGRLHYSSTHDGRAVLAAYRVPDGVPVAVQAVYDVDVALASFRHTRAIAIAGLAAIVLSGLLAALAWVRQAQAAAVLRAADLARAAQEEQRRSHAELMHAVTSFMAQGLAAWGADGRLLVCNTRYLRMLDLPEDLVVPGRHYLDVSRYTAARGDFGPGDPEAQAQARFAAASRGDGHRFTRTRPDGTVIEIAGGSMPGGGFVTTFTDVTASHAAQRALAVSEARFRLLAEHSGDVVTLADMDGRRMYVSPASERVLGWCPEEMVGRPARDFAHPDDLHSLDAALLALREGAPEAQATYRHRRADGSWMWVDAHARRHADESGKAPDGYVGILRDATERKRAERELLDAYEQMSLMALTDTLTGIANRRRFEAVLETEWRRCAREELPISVLLVDVDFFKRYNDRHGHPAGDVCLREVASVIDGVARRPLDLAARIGGEEFALLLPNTDETGAEAVGERLRATMLARAIPHEGNAAACVVTVSVGAATARPQPESGPAGREALLAAADAGLYEAKKLGRNRVGVVEARPRGHPVQGCFTR